MNTLPGRLYPKFRLVLAPLALALLIAGCGGEKRSSTVRAERIANGHVILNIASDPSSLNPNLANELGAARAIVGLQRGLTMLDTQSRPHPELAERWEISEDGRTYTFYLRDAQWTNGESVTAEDFVYSWTRRMLDPTFGSINAYQFFYIKGAKAFYQDPSLGPDSVGVRALASNVLQVELENPTPFFLQLVAHHSYFPVHAATDRENPNWHQHTGSYVGNGPYRLTDYEPGYRIVMEKNPLYWDADNVHMQCVTLFMIEQESTERIAFENGELDATQNVPQQDIVALSSRPEYRVAPQVATYFLNINTREAPLSDPRVRRALNLAIDRQAIVEYVTRGGQPVALHLTPPVLYDGVMPETPLRDAAYDEARALLAEAGYPNGEGFPTLTYIYNTMEGHRKIAVVLQETWKKELGINLELNNQEFKVILERRRAGDYDIARAGWTADFPDPMNFLELYDSASDNNDPGWHDAQYDAMLAAARAEVDPERRMQLMREAEAYLLENAPFIPLYFYVQSYLVAPGLEGYELNAMGMFDPARLRWVTQEEE